MTPTEFFHKCEHFDWYFEWSDDFRVWSSGLLARNNLRDIAKNDPILRNIYTAWVEYSFSGFGFGNAQKPKPVLEDYIGK